MSLSVSIKFFPSALMPCADVDANSIGLGSYTMVNCCHFSLPYICFTNLILVTSRVELAFSWTIPFLKMRCAGIKRSNTF